jgi:DNA-binding beta-propeller fold protein YncE
MTATAPRRRWVSVIVTWAIVGAFAASLACSGLHGPSTAAVPVPGRGPAGVGLADALPVPSKPIDPSAALSAGPSGGNSSAVPEPLSPVGRIPTATPPVAVTLDDGSGLLYVTRQDFAGVSLYGSAGLVENVPLGYDPGPLAYDPVNGYVYVVNVCGGVYSGGCSATNHPNGTVAVVNNTTVVASVAVGIDPVAIAVDPSSGTVYVASRNSSLLSVIDGTALSANYYLPLGADAAVFDPATGTLDVADPSAQAVLLFGPHGQTKTIPDTADPVALAYDEPLGEVGVANDAPASIAWINGTTFAGTVDVPLSTIDALFFDPANGLEYVSGVDQQPSGAWIATFTAIPGALTDSQTPWFMGFGTGLYLAQSAHVLLSNFSGPATRPGPASLTEYGTLLASDPLVADTNGTVPGEVDEGAQFNLSAWVWSTGTEVIASSVLTISPGNGLACGPVIPGPVGPSETFRSSCYAYAAGGYQATRTVQDSSGSWVSAWTTVSAAPDPLAGAPGFTIGNTSYPGQVVGPTPGPDAGQAIVLDAKVVGGSGPFSYTWSGLDLGNCSSVQGPHPRCVFPEPGDYAIGLTVEDAGAGWNATSPSIALVVYPPPVLEPPVFSLPRVSLGEALTGSVAESGGDPPFAYRWFGLPEGCSEQGREVRCAPSAPGLFHVQVEVADSNGFVARSSVVNLTVVPSSSLANVPSWVWLAAVLTAAGVLVLLVGVAIRRSTPVAQVRPRSPAHPALVYGVAPARSASPAAPAWSDRGPEPWTEAKPDDEAPPWE